MLPLSALPYFLCGLKQTSAAPVVERRCVTNSQVAVGFGAIPHGVSLLTLWVWSEASLLNTSVESNSVVLGFPDFMALHWVGGGEMLSESSWRSKQIRRKRTCGKL